MFQRSSESSQRNQQSPSVEYVTFLVNVDARSMIDYSLAGSQSVDSLRHSFFVLPSSTTTRTQQRGSSVQRSVGGGSSTLFHGITFNLSGTMFETSLSLVVVPLFSSVRFVRLSSRISCRSYRNSLSLAVFRSIENGKHDRSTRRRKQYA